MSFIGITPYGKWVRFVFQPFQGRSGRAWCRSFRNQVQKDFVVRIVVRVVANWRDNHRHHATLYDVLSSALLNVVFAVIANVLYGGERRKRGIGNSKSLMSSPRHKQRLDQVLHLVLRTSLAS